LGCKYHPRSCFKYILGVIVIFPDQSDAGCGESIDLAERQAGESYELMHHDPENNATPQILPNIFQAPDAPSILRIAENPATPLDVLEAMAYSADTKVRLKVAANQSTPIAVLENLALDESPDVRLFVASTDRLSRDVLRKLAKDQNPYVVSAALKTLDSLLQSDCDRLKLSIQRLLALRKTT
jgi:hypothetical protein